MGLISEYGANLLDKVFFWRADFRLSNPGDVWFIGKITGYRSKLFPVCKVYYKILLASHVWNGRNEEFNLDDVVDKNSILVGNSLALEKYLELFDGTNW